jgi:uncharacterized protein with HEPN domain
MARRTSVVTGEILATIEGIETACRGRNLEHFRQDWLLKHGVQRGIEIISEAARHLPAALVMQHPEIPWPQIKAMGNLLRHEYHHVADAVVWNVVVADLPPLKDAVVAMHRQALSDEG